MKKNVFMLVFAAAVAFSFTSCKKCFQCTVTNAIYGSVYTEPMVTCGEKMDDHKSVLEQTFSCATCNYTVEQFGGTTTFTDTQCGTTEDVDIFVADELDEDDPDLSVTCSKSTPTVNCYEAS